jgi:hypothetical protein
MCACFQIYSPEDEVTKPPKRWVALPWPVRVDKNSRHASGLSIGEEYIPPTLDYSNKNITGQMSSGDAGIEHVKQSPEQMILSNPTRGHDDWDIVPDPSSDGGFRLVESSSGNINPAELSQQGSSSSTLYGNGNTYQENKGKNNGRSPNILGTGMASGATITSGVSSGAVSEFPSKNVLSSGMSSAAVVGTGVSIGSGYQRPSVAVLGQGLGSGVGDDSSTKGNRPLPHADWDISPGGHSHTLHVPEKDNNSGVSSLSKVAGGVSTPEQSQSQFPPAAHWHVSSIGMGPSQKVPLVAAGVMPAAGQYQSSLSVGSAADTAAL